jgi:hypothetical protein
VQLPQETGAARWRRPHEPRKRGRQNRRAHPQPDETGGIEEQQPSDTRRIGGKCDRRPQGVAGQNEPVRLQMRDDLIDLPPVSRQPVPAGAHPRRQPRLARHIGHHDTVGPSECGDQGQTGGCVQRRTGYEENGELAGPGAQQMCLPGRGGDDGPVMRSGPAIELVNAPRPYVVASRSRAIEISHTSERGTADARDLAEPPPRDIAVATRRRATVPSGPPSARPGQTRCP